MVLPTILMREWGAVFWAWGAASVFGITQALAYSVTGFLGGKWKSMSVIGSLDPLLLAAVGCLVVKVLDRFREIHGFGLLGQAPVNTCMDLINMTRPVLAASCE